MNLRTRGEGVKKSENSADVINGSPPWMETAEWNVGEHEWDRIGGAGLPDRVRCACACGAVIKGLLHLSDWT